MNHTDEIKKEFYFTVVVGNSTYEIPVTAADFNAELAKPKYTSPMIQYQEKKGVARYTFLFNKQR